MSRSRPFWRAQLSSVGPDRWHIMRDAAARLQRASKGDCELQNRKVGRQRIGCARTVEEAAGIEVAPGAQRDVAVEQHRRAPVHVYSHAVAACVRVRGMQSDEPSHAHVRFSFVQLAAACDVASSQKWSGSLRAPM